MSKFGTLLTVHRMDARRKSTLLMHTHIDLKKALHQAHAKIRLLRLKQKDSSDSSPPLATDASTYSHYIQLKVTIVI